jgi:hypothetical protein
VKKKGKIEKFDLNGKAKVINEMKVKRAEICK